MRRIESLFKKGRGPEDRTENESKTKGGTLNERMGITPDLKNQILRYATMIDMGGYPPSWTIPRNLGIRETLKLFPEEAERFAEEMNIPRLVEVMEQGEAEEWETVGYELLQDLAPDKMPKPPAELKSRLLERVRGISTESSDQGIQSGLSALVHLRKLFPEEKAKPLPMEVKELIKKVQKGDYLENFGYDQSDGVHLGYMLTELDVNIHPTAHAFAEKNSDKIRKWLHTEPRGFDDAWPVHRWVEFKTLMADRVELKPSGELAIKE